MVLNSLMEKEIGPSPTASGKHVEVESERKRSKKAARRAEKRAEKALLQAGQEAESAAKAAAVTTEASEEATKPAVDPSGLFMIDTNPSKVEWPNVQAAVDEAQSTGPGAESAEGGPQLNHHARRRLKLIAREKEKIQKRQGIEVGSTEPNQAVDTALAAFIENMDRMAAAREERKQARTQKQMRRMTKRKDRLMKVIQSKESDGVQKPESHRLGSSKKPKRSISG
jgi:hypothetical protein